MPDSLQAKIEAFYAAYNSNDAEQLRSQLCPEFDYYDVGWDLHLAGAEAFIAACLDSYHNVFPDHLIQLREIWLTGDDRAAVKMDWSGTLKKDAFGASAGTVVKGDFCTLFEFRKGLLRRQYDYSIYRSAGLRDDLNRAAAEARDLWGQYISNH